MPRVEELAKLAAILEVDAAYVFQAARGVPAAQLVELLARENRWRALLERVTDAIFTVDAHGRLKDVNGRFATLVGYAAGDLIQRPLLDLVAPASAPRLLSTLASVATQGNAHAPEIAFRDTRGRERLVDLDAVRIVDGSGAAIGAQMLARDVTEERRLVRELDAERRLLQALYDCIPAACILFDRDGTILSANPLVQNVSTFAADELVGRNAFEVFGDPGPQGCPVTRAFLTASTEQQVSRMTNRSGKSVYVHRTAGPIVSDGVVGKVIEILVDVTKQIEAGDLRLLALCDPETVEQHSTGVERRALPRVTTDFPASYRWGDGEADATITSLGPGGVFLKVEDERLRVGDHIELEWQLPSDDAAIRARGVVVWTRPASSQRTGGIGVKFTGVTPALAPIVLKRSS